jgi:hypothetical protein
MSGNAINFPPGVQRLESIFWGWDGKTKRLVHQKKVLIPNWSDAFEYAVYRMDASSAHGSRSATTL